LKQEQFEEESSKKAYLSLEEYFISSLLRNPVKSSASSKLFVKITDLYQAVSGKLCLNLLIYPFSEQVLGMLVSASHDY